MRSFGPFACLIGFFWLSGFSAATPNPNNEQNGLAPIVGDLHASGFDCSRILSNRSCGPLCVHDHFSNALFDSLVRAFKNRTEMSDELFWQKLFQSIPFEEYVEFIEAITPGGDPMPFLTLMAEHYPTNHDLWLNRFGDGELPR